jgi:hypothetical protein
MTTSLSDYRRQHADAPWAVIAQSAEWTAVVNIFTIWAREKLAERHGYTSAELDAIEHERGVKFPCVLREWWRLAGKHPFVDPGLDDGGYQCFCLPSDRPLGSQNGLTLVTIDDTQSGMENGILDEFIDQPNPITHGRNKMLGAEDLKPGQSYRDEGDFIINGSDGGLTIPALIHATLIAMLCGAGWAIDFHRNGVKNDKLVNGVVFVRPLKDGHSVHEKEVKSLGLITFEHRTAFGTVYSNGRDIAFYWLAGYLCLSDRVATRVRTVLTNAGAA